MEDGGDEGNTHGERGVEVFRCSEGVHRPDQKGIQSMLYTSTFQEVSIHSLLRG